MTIFICEIVSTKDAEWGILAKLLDLDLFGPWNKPKSNLSLALRIVVVSKMILYSLENRFRDF